MAVNAAFRADFDTFVAAVEKADVKLAEFQGDVTKIGKSLDRMADSFSGRQVIEQATLMSKAITNIGGATTLTVTEMQRVNAVVTEAIAKYDALGKQAPADLKLLADATGKVAQEAKNIEPPMTMAQRATGLLASSDRK